jgi:hypothetical protein
LLRTDGILRGVVLGAGLHHVVFTYRPAGLTAGLTISLLGWTCVAALCLCRRWRDDRSP